jgi:hypothetical protein
MSSIPHGATAPAVLPVNPDGIPDSLKALPRWVLWRYDPVKDTPGEFSKVLYRTTGNKARANDERTWATFDAVIKVYQRGGWAGVGIALGDGIVGVDLDDVRGPDGVLTTFGRNILDGATTYHEVSPSGTGVKAFAFVDVEGGKGTGAEPIEGGQSIEVYKGVDTTEPRPVGEPILWAMVCGNRARQRAGSHRRYRASPACSSRPGERPQRQGQPHGTHERATHRIRENHQRTERHPAQRTERRRGDVDRNAKGGWYRPIRYRWHHHQRGRGSGLTRR